MASDHALDLAIQNDVSIGSCHIPQAMVPVLCQIIDNRAKLGSIIYGQLHNHVIDQLGHIFALHLPLLREQGWRRGTMQFMQEVVS